MEKEAGRRKKLGGFCVVFVNGVVVEGEARNVDLCMTMLKPLFCYFAHSSGETDTWERHYIHVGGLPEGIWSQHTETSW